MQYRRARIQGGSYFFTVVTHNRRKIFAADKNIEILRAGFQYVMRKHPFRIDAHVILPDHAHFIWTLPDDDSDFSMRWRLIKSYFTRHFQAAAAPRYSLWQKKFWEHLIRDERDMKNHVEYIHYNPVKHGLVQSPIEWPFSSIHRYILEGFYTPDWGKSEPLFSDDRVGNE
jgi:putative transposase